jgi:peroxiredoxin
LRDDYDKFEDKGLGVAVVTQGNPAQTAELRRRYDAPLRFLADPDRKAYRAYGLERGSVVQVMGPRVMLKAAMAALGGNVGGRMVGDVFQMPGTFVIDREGALRFCHRNRDAADNPPNQTLLALAEQLQ